MFVFVCQIFLHALSDVLRALQALQPVRVEAAVRGGGTRVRHSSHRQLAAGARTRGRGGRHVGRGAGQRSEERNDKVSLVSALIAVTLTSPT